MTSREMLHSFEVQLRRLYPSAGKVFTTQQVEMFLNKAQDSYVQRNVALFDTNELAKRSLGKLVRRTAISSPSANQLGSFPEGVFYDLPSDFMYTVSEQVTATNNNTESSVRIMVKPVTYDQYAINVDNPFKCPCEDVFWRMIAEHDDDTLRHEVIGDGEHTIDTYVLSYLKRPAQISIVSEQDCELDEFSHQTIVEAAVGLALATLLEPSTTSNNT